MVIDLKQAGESQDIVVDICIVGAGAAGSVLALELAKSGKKILLAESGGFHADPATQALYDLDFAGMPFRRNFVNRVREYGGACNIWTGRNMPYQPIDFSTRKWVNESRWPIELNTLTPFYERSGSYFNIPGFSKFDLKCWASALDPIEQTIISCQDLSTTVSLWARNEARFGFGSGFQKEIESAKNIQTALWSNLVQLELQPNFSGVKSAEFKSLNGNLLTVSAKNFILACGGLENARLLLLSDQQIPQGLGNQHDNVGRYFMDHPKFDGGVIELLKPNRLNHLAGRPLINGKVRLGLGLSESVQKKEKLLNPYLTLTPYFLDKPPSYNQPVKMAEDKAIGSKPKPHFQKLIRYYLANALKPAKTRRFKLTNYLEQEPRRESRVFLGEKRDALGLKKLVLDWQIGDKALHSLERLHFYLGKHLEEQGIGTFAAQVNFSDSIHLSDASHHIGTTRMSEQPASGVVDANCKVFELDNLYLAGSSIFPTSGHANPTFTIVAMAIRLAEHLKMKY